MKHQRTILRAAALISSVSIVAVYVSCQTKEKAPVQEAPDVMGGTKSRAVFTPPPPQEKKTMGGSKSLAPILNVGEQPAQPK